MSQNRCNLRRSVHSSLVALTKAGIAWTGRWGLAKAAELNGVPGAPHLLELKTKIPLSSEQIAEIHAEFKSKQAKSIESGKLLIVHENDLELAFSSGTVSNKSLRTMLKKLGRTRSQESNVHFSAHLTMATILSSAQTLATKRCAITRLIHVQIFR